MTKHILLSKIKGQLYYKMSGESYEHTIDGDLTMNLCTFKRILKKGKIKFFNTPDPQEICHQLYQTFQRTILPLPNCLSYIKT